MASCRVLAVLSALALSLCRVSASAVLPSTTLAANDGGILRLRGGFARTLAAAGALKEVPKLHHFSGKLSGGAESLPASTPSFQPSSPKERTTSDEISGPAGALVPVNTDADAAEAEDDEGAEEVPYNWEAIHHVDPWKRAAVNADVFDAHTKGRNMILGSRFSVPFIPFLTISVPFGKIHNSARLSRDKGSWLNRFVRSPIQPLPGLFSNRRSDPIEAMQRRPFLVIPLETQGPQDQPHPLSRPVDKKACTGGTVQMMRTLQIENGDILNYLELQAGGPSTFSSIGIIDALTHDPDSRDYDFQCSPAEESAMFYGHGALKWTLDTEGTVPAHFMSEQSSVAAASRSFRGGDRVGILVDLAARKLAILINGKVVLTRSYVPNSRPLRFVAGCVEPGASWRIVNPDKARASLKNVDWEALYEIDSTFG